VQSVFLCDKALNMIEDRLIFDLIFHESILQRGCDRNGQGLMLRPPETAVNRCSVQQDGSGIDCQKKVNVPGTSPRAWPACSLLTFPPASLSPIKITIATTAQPVRTTAKLRHKTE
jgi:hypothetical protein